MHNRKPVLAWWRLPEIKPRQLYPTSNYPTDGGFILRKIHFTSESFLDTNVMKNACQSLLHILPRNAIIRALKHTKQLKFEDV